MSPQQRCGAVGGAWARSMMRWTAVAVITAAGAAATPVGAINSVNSAPAPERTEVGALLMAVDVDGDGVIDAPAGFCSGAMIDDDTFLTAAHCTDGLPSGTRFFVTLEEDFLSLLLAHAHLPFPAQVDLSLANGWIIEGDAHRDPAFPGSSADAHDIAVIDFAARATTPADVRAFTPATLPTAGLLDELGSRVLDGDDWLVVGYGSQEAVRGPGGLTHPGGLVRLKAPVDFNALNDTWVRLAMNTARDLGGTCYGDSGGPTYVEIDGALVLAAITITGDIPCYATSVAYRTDTPSARAFLAGFVSLP